MLECVTAAEYREPGYTGPCFPSIPRGGSGGAQRADRERCVGAQVPVSAGPTAQVCRVAGSTVHPPGSWSKLQQRNFSCLSTCGALATLSELLELPPKTLRKNLHVRGPCLRSLGLRLYPIDASGFLTSIDAALAHVDAIPVRVELQGGRQQRAAITTPQVGEYIASSKLGQLARHLHHRGGGEHHWQHRALARGVQSVGPAELSRAQRHWAPRRRRGRLLDTRVHSITLGDEVWQGAKNRT